MKKIVLSIISLAVALTMLTGCMVVKDLKNAYNEGYEKAGKDIMKENLGRELVKSDEYGCVTVLKTTWGMELRECISLLKLEDNTEIKYNSEGHMIFESEETVFGEKANVTFVFDSTNPIIPDGGLQQVDVEFEKSLDLEFVQTQIEDVHDFMSTQVTEKRKEDPTNKNQFIISYTNKNKLADLEDSLKSACGHKIADIFPADNDWIEAYMNMTALSSVDVYYDKDKKVSRIVFEGRWAGFVNAISKDK